MSLYLPQFLFFIHSFYYRVSFISFKEENIKRISAWSITSQGWEEKNVIQFMATKPEKIVDYGFLSGCWMLLFFVFYLSAVSLSLSP